MFYLAPGRMRLAPLSVASHGYSNRYLLDHRVRSVRVLLEGKGQKGRDKQVAPPSALANSDSGTGSTVNPRAWICAAVRG